MKDSEFRRIALRQPAAFEGAHMGHPDFRVDDRIFATLDYPGEGYGVVMLSPEEQAVFVATHPSAFTPVTGAWGRPGCTRICLKTVDAVKLEKAIGLARRRKAP